MKHMLTLSTLIIAVLLSSGIAWAQSGPLVHLSAQPEIINCPNSPVISMPVSLATAGSQQEQMGFMMLSLTFSDGVLSSPPRVEDILPGWTVDVYWSSFQWEIELTRSSGFTVIDGNDKQIFRLEWDYQSVGSQFVIEIVGTDLGLNSSNDEVVDYPLGSKFIESFTCPVITANIDVVWSLPALVDCPDDPALGTTVALGSSFQNETWDINFFQFTVEVDRTVLGAPYIDNVLPGWMVDIYSANNYWVIEITSGINETISINPTDFFNLYFPYLNEGMPYSMEIIDAEVGVVADVEILHYPNGKDWAGTEKCPCNIRIENLYTICETECSSKGTVVFDAVIKNGPGGLLRLRAGAVDKYVNIPAGDYYLVDQRISDLVFNGSPIPVEASFNGFGCADQSVVQPIPCGPCSLKIKSVDPGSCDGLTNQYELKVAIQVYATCNQIVNVSIDNGPVQQYQLSGNKDTLVVKGLPADGANHTIRIADTTLGTGCSDAGQFLAPSNCSATTGVQAPPYVAERISIGPNPFKDNITISSDSDALIQSVQVFNTNGQLVQRTNAIERISLDIDLHHLVAGMYLVRLHTDQGPVIYKIMKQ